MPIDIMKGMQPAQAKEMATQMGFTGEQAESAAKSIEGLYKVFRISSNDERAWTSCVPWHDVNVICGGLVCWEVVVVQQEQFSSGV